MLSFDRGRFFADWPARVRLPLTDARRKSVEFLLDAFEHDASLTMIRELAYVLATVRWESGHTFDPVRERRANAQANPKLFALQQKYWPSGYFGRGYVQMTWERNYRLAGGKLAGETFTVGGVPVTFAADTLLLKPDYLLERAVSYRVAVRGMREGWFTGKRLSQFITNGAPPDYVNARRIINGTDRAAQIAAMANEFELLLRGAAVSTPLVIADAMTVIGGASPDAMNDEAAPGPVKLSVRKLGSLLSDGVTRVRAATRRRLNKGHAKEAKPAKRRGTRPSPKRRGTDATGAAKAPKGAERSPAKVPGRRKGTSSGATSPATAPPNGATPPVKATGRRTRRAVVRPLLAGLIVGALAGLTPPTLGAQGVARLAITPSTRTLAVGDSLRLTAQAMDAAGNPVAGATIRFSALGGRMQGSVDSLGWVRAGAPGTIPVSVVAVTPNGRPYAERVEVRAVPGPAARIAVTPRISKLLAGQRVRLEATVLSATGDAREDRVTWSSSDPRILRVVDGFVTGVGSGKATLTARAGSASSDVPVAVVPSAGVRVALTPERVEARQGDVVRFTATAKDRRGEPIAGLLPTWSFSPGQGAIDQDGAFVGNTAGKYVVSASFGDLSADATVNLIARDVRRAATVIGRLPRTQFYSSEFWIHPNGRNAYLGTTLGGDRIYALDISNPGVPVITDSIVANSRSMNDIMTTADGKWMVFTREGAADRKNGIVIASTADPAHPKPVSEFTEGVTAGVHSAFVYTHPKYGTHVYLTNSGTGSLNIVDINDPLHPKLVSEWRTKETRAGRSLHDIDVKDGLAYVSYWSDGLVILDVGNGMKGGTPSSPTLVSNYRYNAEALYPDATVRYGPGFISGTHTAWRHRNYVFIADEVFPPSAPTGTWDVANIRAYGRLQVIDVSDIEKPKSVAWYEPEYGGVHNVWVAGDTLYLGAYNGGFHAFDVSGELRGDLKAQGREIVDLSPADANGVVPNKAFTWGVVVKDGLAYVNDMITGLWIVRIEPKRVVP